MGVTRIVDLINTFSAQCCMSVGKSGHERVKHYTHIAKGSRDRCCYAHTLH